MKLIKNSLIALIILSLGIFSSLSMAQQKMRMGLFIASSALPYFIAKERGYFAAEGLDVEGVPLATQPLVVQGIVTGDLDAASNLLSLEGANINALRPDTLKYISLNCQNVKYQLEAYVVPVNSPIKTLAELKGKRIMSAPGPGNLFVAKGVLKGAGLDEKDYQMQEQQMSVHIGGMQSGQFDAAYTLEPIVSMMVSQGVGRKLESGVIAKYMLGRPDACAVLGGGVLSSKFIKENPQAAERFARAWSKALNDGNNDPKARDLLVKHMNTSASIAQTVPLSYYKMARDLSTQDIADFQNLINQATTYGLVKEKIDAKSFLKVY